MQRRVTLPSALVIGVVLAVAGSAAFAMATITDMMQPEDSRTYEGLIRWSVFNGAVNAASVVLVGGALFSIANRTWGLTRTMLLIAAWVHVGWLLWLLARPFVFELLPSDKLRWFDEYGWRIVAIGLWVGLGCITVAARAWWRPAAWWVTVAAVVLLVFESISWAPYLKGVLDDVHQGHPYLARVIWPVREALVAGALLIVVQGILRDAPSPLPMPGAATAWLRRANASLLIRLVAAIALALLSIGLIRSPGGLKYMFLLGPAITILAIFGFAHSLLGVERAELPGMPKLRLVLGAAFTATAAAMQTNQMLAAYRMLKDDSFYSQEKADAWSIIGPLVGIIGTVLACSAIGSWAGKTGNECLRQSATARAVIHAVLTVLVMVTPYLITKVPSKGAMLGIGLLAAGCSVAALVVVATVFRRAADSIAPGPTLPEARLR